MIVKKAWDYIVGHNVWSKVAAWAIYTTIGGFCFGIYTVFKNLSFLGTLGLILNYKLPVWVYLLSAIPIASFTVLIRNYRKKRNSKRPATATTNPTAVKAPTNSSETSMPQSPNEGIADGLIFDSNLATQDWWNGYGQQDWDNQSNSFIGDKGLGDWHFKEHILTIARKNTNGKYIISIRQYFPPGKQIAFIPSNLFGENPRTFKVSFSSRSFSGKHKVTIVFRTREGHSWINKLDFSVSQSSWEPLSGSLTIKADEEFVVELHTWSFDAKSRFQIRDLIIEEKKRTTVK